MTRRNQGSLKHKRKILYDKKAAPYIFVLPFIITFLVFFAYPMISTLIMSFQRIEGFNNVSFIGLGNYKRLFNEHFYNALKTSTVYTICVICVLIPIPVILASFLNSRLLKFRNFFRSAIFVPSLVSVIIAGIAFRLMFSELDTGFFNMLVIALGGEAVKWNMGFGTGMFMMVILATWRTTGVYVVYNLSALQGVPEEIYESASIDGATPYRNLLYYPAANHAHNHLYINYYYYRWLSYVYRKLCLLE